MTSISFTSLFLGLVLGTHPVGVAIEGPASQVAFEVDGRPAGRAGKQPWSTDLDLGRDLAPRELVARALDSGGREVARVEPLKEAKRMGGDAIRCFLERLEKQQTMNSFQRLEDL